MDIKIQKNSGNVSIQLKGNLDGSTACQVEQALDFIRGSGISRLVIDFALVRRLEFFGVALLAHALKNCRHQVTLTGLKPSGEKLFKRFGLVASQPRQSPSLDAGEALEYPSWQTS